LRFISGFVINWLFTPWLLTYQELPARRSCAVLSGANAVSEGGNSCVISSDATTKLASSSEPSQTVLCRRLI
jgi:hypothetical protein